MSGTRKLTVVSLDMTLNAIKCLDQGETIKKVASDLGIGEVTAADWGRKRAETEK
jgi:transposase